MMTSRGLTAYTLRFFDGRTDDDDLDSLFEKAAKNSPAMIVLEDIDRVFPRNGHSGTKISLQQLLNCLDGLTTGDGIILAATANQPVNLDPAILRRPGRFDRVMCFPNPTSELRRKYFSQMHSSFDEEKLDTAVEETEGFSFAQLREAYIMAGQAAFLENREIAADDLLDGIWSLRRTILFGSLNSSSAGFAVPTKPVRSRHR
jgi:SpoVK/Ycf46/Vps4 family AAA+-type ATPase